MEDGGKKQHHFVLIHGVCHGAWCWYRVATILEAAGHRVTALDMAGCGASPGRGEEVGSFEEYSRPLLDAVAALPEGEKAVLVAHSFGGQSLALAMERYPVKAAVAVFAPATMPAAGKPMSFAFKQNLTLAIAMVRLSRRFLNDETMNGDVLTAERYGAVRRVYIVAEDDKWKPAEMQRRMASWNPGTEVMGLQGADHMPMFSKPRELSELLMEIANKYRVEHLRSIPCYRAGHVRA
ncbi:putative esterase PIR7A [Dichanthelium oligosanthes]|uniref:Putative esterase PIR7A n=1 Tax=Dichanthelium oligosanthes TaxID=888268 RepID=A0A1E5W1N3_9POAL|nr:putative esterase PIR7A [Dichanthelium oligosanthes]